MRNMTYMVAFLVFHMWQTCGDMPNTPNTPQGAFGCLGEGGAPTWETRACVTFSGVQQVGEVEEEGQGAWWWLFLQKQGHGWSVLQKHTPRVVLLAETRVQVVGSARTSPQVVVLAGTRAQVVGSAKSHPRVVLLAETRAQVVGSARMSPQVVVLVETRAGMFGAARM